MIKFFINCIEKNQRKNKVEFLVSCDDSSRYVNIQGLSDGIIRLDSDAASMEIKYICPLYFIYAVFYPLIIDNVNDFVITSYYNCHSDNDDDFKIRIIHDLNNNSILLKDLYYENSIQLDAEIFKQTFIQKAFEIIELYEDLYPGVGKIPEIKSIKDFLFSTFTQT